MVNQTRPFGFNVIGFATGNLGLGVAARSTIDVIRGKGADFQIIDLDPGLGRGGREQAYEGVPLSDSTTLPYAINLFVVAPPTLAQLIRQSGDLFFAPGHVNAALPFWELPILAQSDRTTLDMMDAIVAVSHSMRGAYEFAVSGPVVMGGTLPVTLPANVAPAPERFGLSPNAFKFVGAFEPHSDPQRKNPFATIEAFRSAFPDRTDVTLAIRVNNATSATGRHPAVAELERACASAPNITLVDEPLGYADVLSLYASCDVYVSLHRAEGLGLAPLEAMLLGKPVIATAWSGNMTYMDQTNGCLVPYRLVPVNGSVSTYNDELFRAGAQWAEPDVATASTWMKRLHGDRELYARVATAARTSAEAFNVNARRGQFVDELHAIWQNSHFLPQRDRAAEAAAAAARPRSEFSAQETRIRQLEADLRWIESRVPYQIWRKARGLLRKVKS